MQITSTEITEGHVRIRFADHPEDASSWIDIRLSLADLKNPTPAVEMPADIESWRLAAIRLAALRAARETIGAETQRLSGLVERTHG